MNFKETFINDVIFWLYCENKIFDLIGYGGCIVKVYLFRKGNAELCSMICKKGTTE